MDAVLRPFIRLILPMSLAVFAASAVGCVQRRMTIRSNPPGAVVYVDDYEIGTTPVSTDYIYYGTRKIRLVRDGYETLTVYQPMKTPWYQWPGIEFITDNLWPCEIRDERTFEYQMQPAITVPTDQLLGRAEQLRASSRVLPAGAAQPVTTLPPGAVPAGALLPGPQTAPITTAPGVLPAPMLPPPGATTMPGQPGTTQPQFLPPR